MAAIPERKNNKNSKLWLTLFIVAGLIYLIDFIFYGQRIHDIAGASGFGLMAFGAWKNDKIASNLGGLLVVGAIAAKYLLWARIIHNLCCGDSRPRVYGVLLIECA